MKKLYLVLGLIGGAVILSLFSFVGVWASQITGDPALPSGLNPIGSTSTIIYTTSTNHLSWSQFLTFDENTFLTRMRNLNVSGYVNHNVFTISASSTISPTDELYYANVATLINPITVTLPIGAVTDFGRTYYFTDVFGNAATNNITIATQAADTINGASTYVINRNYDCVGVENVGTRWVIISSCPQAAAATPNLQQVTTAGNVTTLPIQFAGGTSTADFVIQGNATTTGNAYIGGKLTVVGDIDPTRVLLSGADKRFGATDAGSIYLAPFANSTDAVQVRRADNSTVVLNVNTTNSRVGVKTTAPQKELDVVGSVQNIYTASSTISQIGTVNVSGSTGFQIAKSGQNVYLTDLTSSTLSIVDVSKSTAPVQKGSIVLTGQLRGVAVADGVAYVVSTANLLYLVDVSESANPRVLTSIAITDPRCVLATGDLVFACENNGATSKIKIFNVASSTAPFLLGSAAMDEGVAGKIDVKGKFLYAPASSSSTISIFDITDPTSPVLKSRTAITGGAFQVESSGNILYAVNTSGRITVMDVASSTAPTVIASTTVATANGSMFLADRWLYMVGSSLIRIVDVSDPYNPTLVVSPAIAASGSNIWVDGQLAYIVFSTVPNKLTIYNLGGTETNSLIAGTARFGKASVLQDMFVGGFLNIDTGLRVGQQGIMTSGGLVVQGNATLNGSLNLRRLAVANGTTTIAAGDQVQIIGVTTAAGTSTINLPTAASVGSGRVYTVKDEGGNALTNNITVSRSGSDTIDGATTKVINLNYDSYDFYSDGVSKWFVK